MGKSNLEGGLKGEHLKEKENSRRTRENQRGKKIQGEKERDRES